MTSFMIDTGASQFNPLDRIPAWFRDQADNMDDPALLRSYGMHILGTLQVPRTQVGWLRRPKLVNTVRDHLLADWMLLRDLAKAYPDIFDEILAAYAERVAAG
jgi:hypothetical protein